MTDKNLSFLTHVLVYSGLHHSETMSKLGSSVCSEAVSPFKKSKLTALILKKNKQKKTRQVLIHGFLSQIMSQNCLSSSVVSDQPAVSQPFSSMLLLKDQLENSQNALQTLTMLTEWK